MEHMCIIKLYDISMYGVAFVLQEPILNVWIPPTWLCDLQQYGVQSSQIPNSHRP